VASLEGFDYTIKMRMTFTATDLVLIGLAAFRHYDGACTAQVKRGGCLYAALCWRAHTGDSKQIVHDNAWNIEGEEDWVHFLSANQDLQVTDTFSFRDLDTMLKSLEYYGTGVRTFGILRDALSLGDGAERLKELTMLDGMAEILRRQISSALDKCNERYDELRDLEAKV
jgi:hypothetical protein